MDPFAVIMLGGTAGLVAGLYLIGHFASGDGRRSIDWDPMRRQEEKIQGEIDDLDQMLEAANARRRRRGRPELTEESLHAEISAQTREASKRREQHLADLEIVQMLEVKNKRRAAKGLPELTVAEYRARIERGL